MLPTARSAPSHSARPLARALSGLSSSSSSGAGDSAEFLQGEWGLMFGERLRLLARTQNQSQPTQAQSQRTPFAMPAPRPAAASFVPVAATAASLASITPSMSSPYNPLFWQHKISPAPTSATATALAANVSLLQHPALPLALHPTALVPPNSSSSAFVLPTQPQTPPVQYNVEPSAALDRSSRKRKRGILAPSPAPVVVTTNTSANATRPGVDSLDLPVDAPSPARGTTAAMALKTADNLPTSVHPTDSVSSSSAPEVVVREAPARRKAKTTSVDVARATLESREQRRSPRTSSATPGPLDVVMQEARARRRTAANPVKVERALSRAVQALREQHALVLDDARDFDVGMGFDAVDSQLVGLEDLAISRTVAVQANTAPRVTPIRRDTNLGNKDPQSLETFRASFTKDVARGDTRQAVRRMSRLLCKKSFLRHPDRGAFFDVAVHALLQKGEYAAACNIHKWMTDEGFLTSPAVLTGLVCALNDGEGVLEALDEMPSHVDEPLLAAALSRLQASLPAVQLEQLAERHRYQRGRGVTCIMINAHARCGDLPAAARWLERYRTTAKPGHALEPAPYAALMAAHLRAGDPAAALGVLALMQADDVAPTLGIYNMLLAARAGPDGVERAFRVAKIIPPELWARADAFTFAALWKAHERWRAALVLRTGAPQPAPRALFHAMMMRARGVVGARLLNVALRVLMLREDYAGALVLLDVHGAPDARTRQAVLGALWRRMRGEVDAQRAAEERARQREVELRDLGRVPLPHQREEEPGRELARWTDRMLAEPGGLRRRGTWLRAYVARGEGLADFEGLFEWLLNLGPEIEREQGEGRDGLVDVRPLRVLLRRAVLASKDVSVLAPIEVQNEVLRAALAKARAQMLPVMERPPQRKNWKRESKLKSPHER